MRTKNGPFISLIFIISWIILGNYILLNLFLAILLDGFNQIPEITEELEAIKPEYELLNFESQSSNELKSYFEEEVECKNSLFIFSSNSRFRKIMKSIVKNKYFDTLILFFIFMTSLNLVFDTYIDDSSNSEIEKEKRKISYVLNIIFNIIFLIESSMKIISYGLIFCPKSYLRDTWNVIDFSIVIVSFIDMGASNLNLPNVKV